MLASGDAVQKTNSNILLTGLGLPSETEPFIKSGICPWMYLWNPVDIGYLAAYSADALVKGVITGEAGETFEAGNLGLKEVLPASDGGEEVMLGDFYKFDIDNIDAWKDAF